MKNEDILNTLKSAYSKITPNNISGVMTELSKKKEENIMPSKKYEKPSFWKFLTPALGAIVIVIGLFIGYNVYQNGQKSIISLDVNPSITIEVNKKEVITDVKAINDDASKILEGIKLEDVDLNTGMHAIIGSMLKHGYIDELKNSVLVTVQNEDSEEGKRLETKVTKEIESLLSSYKIESAIVSQTITNDKELKLQADNNDITIGKAKLINEIIKSNPLYTFEELAKLNIQELNLIANSQTSQLENIEFQGTANEGEYLGRDKAKSIALEHAKVKENDVIFTEVEYDFDDGKMVYEVEFKTTNIEYDYKIDAKTGDILNHHKEYENDYLDDDDDKVNATPNNNTSTSTLITSSQALSIALNDAGLTKSQITDISTEYDYENGKAVYEVEFESGDHEYEYVIDAVTGKILHVEKDD